MPPRLYYATSQKPTSILCSAAGSFTSASALNLILATTSSLEIHTLTSDGLTLQCTLPVHGRVATLRLVRPMQTPKTSPCSLVLTTERCQFMVLQWDEGAGTLKTVSSCDLRVRVLLELDASSAPVVLFNAFSTKLQHLPFLARLHFA